MRESVNKGMEVWKHNGPSSVVQMQITWKDREGNGKVEQNQIMMSFKYNAIFNEEPVKLLEESSLIWKDYQWGQWHH